MNLQERLDRAVEQSRAADMEKAAEAPSIYDKESWERDCAGLITNEELRYDIQRALFWIEATQNGLETTQGVFRCAKRITDAAQSIGMTVIQNAIAKGLTVENIGKLD